MKKTALVLSGGGARGAYQAGVVKALTEVSLENGINNPFPIITGASAGAINAAFLASSVHQPSLAAENIVKLWQSLTTEQIFKTDRFSLGRIGVRFLRQLTSGDMDQTKSASALLNTDPLRQFITKHLNKKDIQNNIDRGLLHGLGIATTEYSRSERITFVQGHESIPMWERPRRHSERTQIDVEHIMASSAIPLFFPPVKVGNSYFGDGCLRNSAPLSAAIKFGGEPLIVIGVKKHVTTQESRQRRTTIPSLAVILSTVINTLFMDPLDVDIERYTRINQLLDEKEKRLSELRHYRQSKMLYIRPSGDLGLLAKDHVNELPKTIRFLLKGLGTDDEAADVISYLLFEPGYINAAINMGYKDALAHRNEYLKLVRLA